MAVAITRTDLTSRELRVALAFSLLFSFRARNRRSERSVFSEKLVRLAS